MVAAIGGYPATIRLQSRYSCQQTDQNAIMNSFCFHATNRLPPNTALYQQFLDDELSKRFLDRLQNELPLGEHYIRIFGRCIKEPRLSCWVADQDAAYTYSGQLRTPMPWTPTLRELCDRVETKLNTRFNGVLCNLYRDGRDSMGWHSDDERELGSDPVIASLSLGAERRFRWREKSSRKTYSEQLTNGSLLVMSGDTQRKWQHALPKTQQSVGTRLNLTFRYIQP